VPGLDACLRVGLKMPIKSAIYMAEAWPALPDNTRTVEISPFRIAELRVAGGSAIHRSAHGGCIGLWVTACPLSLGTISHHGKERPLLRHPFEPVNTSVFKLKP
jgi:hypothetical protein